MAEKAVNPETQQLGVRIETVLAVDVKVLAVRQRRRFKDLVEEALRDLLKKYQGKKGVLPKGK
jgi:hypothetical protein